MRITPTENGPYKVEGALSLELVDPRGRPIPIQRDVVFLCRCGGSTNKPFCDGTHSRIGFQGAMRAVQPADE
jgi:CDGSH-type Zn-finger protein